MLTNGPEQEANDQQLEMDGEATLEQRLEEATRERDQFRAMAQRAQADFINYKRRIEEERQLIGQEAASQVIMQLLPVLDDFQLALEHLHAEASASWSEGVQMIFRKLQTLLETEGVTAIRPEPGNGFRSCGTGGRVRRAVQRIPRGHGNQHPAAGLPQREPRTPSSPGCIGPGREGVEDHYPYETRPLERLRRALTTSSIRRSNKWRR